MPRRSRPRSRRSSAIPRGARGWAPRRASAWRPASRSRASRRACSPPSTTRWRRDEPSGLGHRAHLQPGARCPPRTIPTARRRRGSGRAWRARSPRARSASPRSSAGTWDSSRACASPAARSTRPGRSTRASPSSTISTSSCASRCASAPSSWTCRPSSTGATAGAWPATGSASARRRSASPRSSRASIPRPSIGSGAGPSSAARRAAGRGSRAPVSRPATRAARSRRWPRRARSTQITWPTACARSGSRCVAGSDGADRLHAPAARGRGDGGGPPAHGGRARGARARGAYLRGARGRAAARRHAPAGAGGARGPALRRALGLADGERVCAAIGSGFARKGFDLLLRLWREAPPRDTALVLVGDDERLGHYRGLAEALGGRVRVTGPRPDVEAVLAAADVACLPSRQEAFGNVVLEACAAGVPVVPTRRAGAAALLEGPLAALVVDDPEDLDALARALAHALGPAHDALAQAARARAEQFPWDKHLDGLAALLTEVARGE